MTSQGCIAIPGTRSGVPFFIVREPVVALVPRATTGYLLGIPPGSIRAESTLVLILLLPRRAYPSWHLSLTIAIIISFLPEDYDYNYEYDYE